MMSINKVNTHIIPIQFHYHAPTSLEQTVKLLEKHRKDAKLLAGGTDLIPHMKQRKVEVEHLINLKKIPNLACIKETSEGIKIGALAKLRTIELSPLNFPFFIVATTSKRILAATSSQSEFLPPKDPFTR